MAKFDDRVSRHFGRIPVEYWEALGTRPGVKAEEALTKLFNAHRRGKVFTFPTPPITGKDRSVWIKPETSDRLDKFAFENAVSITSVLIAALKHFLGDQAPAISAPSRKAPVIRKGRRSKRDTSAAPAELTL